VAWKINLVTFAEYAIPWPKHYLLTWRKAYSSQRPIILAISHAKLAAKAVASCKGAIDDYTVVGIRFIPTVALEISSVDFDHDTAYFNHLKQVWLRELLDVELTCSIA
jgi:hypothetical protein